MQVKIQLVRDDITPSLTRNLTAARSPSRALRAGGQAIVSLALRAFTTPSVRPNPWAPLSPRTLKARTSGRTKRKGTLPLMATTTLSRSPRVTGADNASVTVGSDRRAGGYSLAAIHQLGAPARRIPARPFFPFYADGRLTLTASAAFKAALKAALNLR